MAIIVPMAIVLPPPPSNPPVGLGMAQRAASLHFKQGLRRAAHQLIGVRGPSGETKPAHVALTQGQQRSTLSPALLSRKQERYPSRETTLAKGTFVRVAELVEPFLHASPTPYLQTV